MIPPTNGRVCLYHPGTIDRHTMIVRDEQPMSASIAYVWNDRLISVSVADHNGNTYGRARVQLLQPGDEPPAPGTAFCTWMPYQLGQAGKTEEAEKRAAAART